MMYDTTKSLLLIGAVLFVGYKVVQVKRDVDAVVDDSLDVLTNELNPASDQNLIYQGVQSIGDGLGNTVANWFIDEEYRQ